MDVGHGRKAKQGGTAVLNAVVREGLAGKVMPEKKLEGGNKQGIWPSRGRHSRGVGGGTGTAAALSEAGTYLPCLRNSEEVSTTGQEALKEREEEEED